MNAQDLLSQVIENEAQKLLMLSKASDDPLPGEQLEALQSLATSVRALRIQGASPSTRPEDTDNDVGNLLEKATQ